MTSPHRSIQTRAERWGHERANPQTTEYGVLVLPSQRRDLGTMARVSGFSECPYQVGVLQPRMDLAHNPELVLADKKDANRARMDGAMKGLVAECRICRKEFALELTRYGPGESPGPPNNPLRYRERLRNPDGSLHECATSRGYLQPEMPKLATTAPQLTTRKRPEPKEGPVKPRRRLQVWERPLE